MGKLVPLAVLSLAVLVYYWCFNCCSLDPGTIKDKRVLITGSSSGIGEHLAYQYSKLGARVFITARRASLLEKVAEKCKELGAKQVEVMASDMGLAEDRDKLVAEVKKRFGGLDHLILNHAIMAPGLWLGTKENMTALYNLMNVNFYSFVDLASLALPMLMESKGQMGIVSAVAGKLGIAGMGVYPTTKFAMNGFFSTLRQELLLRNTGVSVTTCIIGPVDTDIVQRTEEKKQEMKENLSYGYDVRATAEDTAYAIIVGVANRQYEIYYGKLAYWMVTLHKIFPGGFEDRMGKIFFDNAKGVFH